MIFHPLQDPIAYRLGWALVHFLWQGALVALLLKVALSVLQRRSPNARYLAGCAAMLCLVALPIVTSIMMDVPGSVTHPGVEGRGPGHVPSPAAASPEVEAPAVLVRVLVDGAAGMPALCRWIDANLRILLLAWVAGVLLFSARLGAGWWQMKRLASGGMALEMPDGQGLLANACRRLGVTRPIKLLESALVEVPTVFGWLRPVMLLPASTLAGLSSQQLEAILAHELAHLRRHDWLVNLLQNVVETVLFYHPAVWWVSAQIRVERENCCDDMVVAAYGDPAGYARALASLESLRDAGHWAMAASGGSLLQRVRRLLGQPPVSTGSGAWVAGAAIVLALGLWFAEGRTATAKATPLDQTGTVGSAISPETPASPETPRITADGSIKLFARTYKLDPPSFLEEIRRAMATPESTAPGSSDFQLAVREFITRAGVFSTNSTNIAVDASPETESNGRALLFNDQTGQLLVRATLDELETLEHALQRVQPIRSQVLVEIKFVELEEGALRTLGLESMLKSEGPQPQMTVTNRTGVLVVPDGATNINLFAAETLRGVEKVKDGSLGILTDTQSRTVLRAIKEQPGANLLAAPGVITLSGRQARIEIADLRNIVTGVIIGERNTFTTSAIPVGPSIDVIPHVSADGRQIQMTLIPGLTAFLGYDSPGPFMPSTGGGIIVPKPLPRFHTSQTLVSALVPDGQTLVLGGFEGEAPPSDQAAFVRPKQIVIFITPMLVDSAGNRVNSD